LLFGGRWQVLARCVIDYLLMISYMYLNDGTVVDGALNRQTEGSAFRGNASALVLIGEA